MKFRALLVLLLCNPTQANDRLLEESSPVENYVGITQQDIDRQVYFVTCDYYLQDCPIRTIKHRALPIRSESPTRAISNSQKILRSNESQN